MALTTTGNHPKALWPGVLGWFGTSYATHDKEYTQLFDFKSSSKKYEEIVENTTYGLAPVKPEGSGVVYDSNIQGVTSRFTNVAYGLGYVVTREELADNLYMEVSKARAANLAFSMNQTRENVGANVYNRAFSGTYLGADGSSLIASDHSALTGGNQSNILSTNADFSEAALEDLTIQIMNAKNSKNLRIALRPTCLIGNVAQVYEFERVLKSVLRVGTADNDPNALRNLGAIPKVVTNHYLTDTDAWFIRTNAPNGLIWFDRESLEFTKDKDFDTDNAKAKAYMRFTTGWADWRGIYGTSGA
jgi:hypothetical protein